MNRQLFVISKARSMTKALTKAGFKPGHRVLIHRNYTPLTKGIRELRFRVWYLFGHVFPCWYQKGVPMPDMLKTGDISFPLFGRLVSLMRKIAEITLLDWFVTELGGVKGAHKERINHPGNRPPPSQELGQPTSA